MPIPQFAAGETLTAPKLQQLGDDLAYTPALDAASNDPTLGSGVTSTGFVWINGQQVDVYFTIPFGSGSTAGAGIYEVSLPTGFPPAAYMTPGMAVGTVSLEDNGGNLRAGVAMLNATNTAFRIKDTQTNAFVANATPWAWASGYQITGRVSYLTDFTGGVTAPDPVTAPINQPWPIDTFTLPGVVPTGGGVEYTIRSGAESLTDWNNALASMNATGGNVVRFLPGQHNGEYRVRGDRIAGGPPNAEAGVAGNHNVITADAGAIITGVQQGASFAFPAISIEAILHWDVIGVTIDGSDFSGIRFMHSGGTSGSRARIQGNTVRNCEHTHIKVRGWFEGGYEPSEFIDVTGNVLDGGSRSRTSPEFAEGFYAGTGHSPPDDDEWVDLTNNVLFAKNLVMGMPSDSLELKTGCNLITIEDNVFHSAALVAGTGGTSIPVGHITLVYANTARPGGDVAVNNVFRRNRLYGLTQASGTVRAPIVVGRGGTDVYSNIVWGCEAAAACHLDSGAGGMGTGNINVDGNTSDGTFVSNVDGYGSLVQSNNIPDQHSVSFVGPTTDDANNSSQGAGSGFAITSGAGTGTGSGRNDATDTAPNSPPDPGALAVV